MEQAMCGLSNIARELRVAKVFLLKISFLDFFLRPVAGYLILHTKIENCTIKNHLTMKNTIYKYIHI